MAHEEIDREIQKFVAFAGDEKIHDRWYVRKLAPKFNWALFLVLLLIFIVPGIFYFVVWKWFTFRSNGYLLLTNRRVIYFEQGSCVGRRQRYVGSLDVEHVSGCRLFARQGVWRFLGFIKLWEWKQMYLNIFTEHFDAITIGAVKTLKRSHFEPAEDMVAVVHEVGARIHELQAAGGVR